MQVELKAKVWWEERDLPHLSARFTNGTRVVSMAMSSTPSTEKTKITTMYRHDSPTILLWDGEEDVTAAVLGVSSLGEPYAEDHLFRAMEWLKGGA